MNNLDKAKKRLQGDFVSPAAEWAYLESLLTGSESQRLALLRWIFAESPAYWETRARAGQILLQNSESETWKIIEELVASNDPDDNGTILTLCEFIDHPRGPQLAQRWLTEETHPATQLEAIIYLKDIFPERVRQRLDALTDHPDPSVRRQAQGMLAKQNN